MEPATRVIQWLDPTDELQHTRGLPSFISFADEVPPHPVIFTGTLTAALDRYRIMGEHAWRLGFPAAVFGPDTVTNVAYPSVSTEAATTSSRVSSVGPVRSSHPTTASCPSRASDPCKHSFFMFLLNLS